MWKKLSCSCDTMVRTSLVLLQLGVVSCFHPASFARAGVSPDWPYETSTITLAHLNFTFADASDDGQLITSSCTEPAQFALRSVGLANGVLVLGVSSSPKDNQATSAGRAANSVEDKNNRNILQNSSSSSFFINNDNDESRKDGCVLRWSPPPGKPWIALLSVEVCGNPRDFYSALEQNASAILVYDANKTLGYRSPDIPSKYKSSLALF